MESVRWIYNHCNINPPADSHTFYISGIWRHLWKISIFDINVSRRKQISPTKCMISFSSTQWTFTRSYNSRAHGNKSQFAIGTYVQQLRASDFIYDYRNYEIFPWCRAYLRPDGLVNLSFGCASKRSWRYRAFASSDSSLIAIIGYSWTGR